ncbi:MAG: gamma carbonic anhydrase family protein [Proteobacteria bacterium]|nr:MAG: gamma carbonic anhydrase family protein [Pseudomonadota bacterium]
MANIRKYLNYTPQIASSAFIDESAVIIGRVKIGENASIWCNAVARGDVADIIIGNNSNIQDLTTLHVTHDNPGKTEETPLIIGNNVTVGHNCCLHACTLHNNILVGMGSTVLDNAVIEDNVMIGAGSLVPPNKHLAGGYLYFGNPVKQIRPLTEAEIAHLAYSAEHYVEIANNHKNS